MTARPPARDDPYYRCELHCNHNLGSGMSIADLLGGETEPAIAVSGINRPPFAGLDTDRSRPAATRLRVAR